MRMMWNVCCRRRTSVMDDRSTQAHAWSEINTTPWRRSFKRRNALCTRTRTHAPKRAMWSIAVYFMAITVTTHRKQAGLLYKVVNPAKRFSIRNPEQIILMAKVSVNAAFAVHFGGWDDKLLYRGRTIGGSYLFLRCSIRLLPYYKMTLLFKSLLDHWHPKMLIYCHLFPSFFLVAHIRIYVIHSASGAADVWRLVQCDTRRGQPNCRTFHLHYGEYATHNAIRRRRCETKAYTRHVCSTCVHSADTASLQPLVHD